MIRHRQLQYCLREASRLQHTAQCCAHAAYAHPFDHFEMRHFELLARPEESSHDCMLRVRVYASTGIAVVVCIEKEWSAS